MTPEIRQRAFDPFFTTRMGKGGSGLGLNIAFNIVTGVLGGAIRLASAPDEGCRFTIRIPLVAPQRRPPEAAA
jgi:signal transduction histidine kinase